MRGGDDATESFDLFLDTICNTFGGIVFLAILLAVMVQSRSVVKSIDQNDRHATPEQVREATSRLAAARATLEQLETTLAGMPSTKSGVDDSQFIALTSEKETLDQQLSELLKSETQAAQTLAARVEKTAEQRQANEAVPLALDEARRASSEASADFKQLVDNKQQTLRLPKVQRASQASVLVLVQADTMYLAKVPALFGQGFNDAQVDASSQPGGGIQVLPKIGTGWDLATSTGQAESLTTIRNAAGQGHSITVAIWADSFKRFGQIRDTLAAEGVMYDLWPQSDGEVLMVFLGGGQTSVQ